MSGRRLILLLGIGTGAVLSAALLVIWYMTLPLPREDGVEASTEVQELTQRTTQQGMEANYSNFMKRTSLRLEILTVKKTYHIGDRITARAVLTNGSDESLQVRPAMTGDRPWGLGIQVRYLSVSGKPLTGTNLIHWQGVVNPWTLESGHSIKRQEVFTLLLPGKVQLRAYYLAKEIGGKQHYKCWLDETVIDVSDGMNPDAENELARFEKRLATADRSTKKTIYREISRRWDIGSARFLMKRLSEEADPEAKANLIMNLGRIAADGAGFEAIPILVEIAKDAAQPSEARLAALRALGRIEGRPGRVLGRVDYRLQEDMVRRLQAMFQQLTADSDKAVAEQAREYWDRVVKRQQTRS